MLLEKVKCPNCGAPVNIRARDAFARCSYCGGQFRLMQDARIYQADAGIIMSANLLAREAAARWLDERWALLQIARSDAEAHHQRKMWQLEHEGALLSLWPLLSVLAFVVGLIFILAGGIGGFAGASLIVSGLVLSLRGWRAQDRLADYEEEIAHRFGETMTQFYHREVVLRQHRQRIQAQIEALMGAMRSA